MRERVCLAFVCLLGIAGCSRDPLEYGVKLSLAPEQGKTYTYDLDFDMAIDLATMPKEFKMKIAGESATTAKVETTYMAKKVTDKEVVFDAVIKTSDASEK